MRSINAKKIAAIAGAALLGAGLAFAGPITFQNTTIISNTGQPVVQVVVGSTAAPSDGVAAANIAAAIGNLAYTSVPVTASVNAIQAANVLHVVGSPSYTLSNQQVWLNESGATTATGGTYIFSALIGSVLNQGVQLGSLQNTKTLQGSSSYSFPETPASVTSSPLTSPYGPVGSVPVSTSVSQSNGGGVTFSSFSTGSSPAYDNILQVSSAQLSGLKQNYGTNGETEYLYLTGFPVYDQQSSVNNFALMNAGGAYEAIFNKPIANRTNSNSLQINAPISLLGQNYTIINATSPGTAVPTTSNYIVGGSMYLASSLAPLQTVYVGKNITSGPWTVQLQDLGETSTAYNSPAAIGVYYKGQLTNESSIAPGTLAKFNVSGNLLYLDVNQTFPGLYSYEKWAKLELYTNVFKITSNHVYNQTTNPGWYTDLLWTNTTATNGKSNQLYGIIIYNVTPTTLQPGQSYTFIQNPATYKVSFIGSTLGTGNFDTVTVGSSQDASVNYANQGSSASGLPAITNVTEPAQELTVTSQIPNAFTYAGQTSSSVTYDLTPYELNLDANTVSLNSPTATVTNVVLNYVDPTAGSTDAWISNSLPLGVTVIGYSTATGHPYTQQSVSFSYNAIASGEVTNTLQLNTALYNVTAIQIQGSDALPIYSNGRLGISVATYNSANTLQSATLATLNSISAGIIYPQSGKVYDGFSTSTQTTYNQQNGQPTTTFSVGSLGSVSAGTGIHNLGSYTINEVADSTPQYDQLAVGLYNNTPGTSPYYILNYSVAGNHNNVTYTPTGGSNYAIQVQKGFRTERGSEVVSISPSSDTFSIAKAIDELQFSVSPGTSNTAVSKAISTIGPFSIGQAITGIPNLTVANIEAKISVSNSSYTIAGINNITATPSVSQATTPVLLKNLSTTPIAVLDSNANPGSTLILVGSGYVNSLSKQLQSSYNISITPTSAPIVEAYGTNRILVAGYTAAQTTQAANTFISDLYAAAASSSS